jgi:hypothetical protein
MSLSKRAFQKWQDSLPDEGCQPDEVAQFEGSSIHALRAAAQDLAALGWQAHDLANEVAEAIAPPAPPIDLPLSGDPFAG